MRIPLFAILTKDNWPFQFSTVTTLPGWIFRCKHPHPRYPPAHSNLLLSFPRSPGGQGNLFWFDLRSLKSNKKNKWNWYETMTHTHKHTKVPSTSSTKTCIHNNMSGNVRRKLLPEFNKTKESEIERFLLDGFWLYIWMSWIVSPNSKNSKKQTTLPKTNLAPEKGHTGKTHGHTGKITINVHLKLHSLLWVIPYRILATNHHLPWCGC